jgi:hypothetical protein
MSEEPIVDQDAVLEMSKETENTLRNERYFWDDIVLRISVNSDDPAEKLVERAIKIADTLLEARRQRFPVKEKEK